MKFQRPSTFGAAMKANGSRSSNLLSSSQGIPRPELCGSEFMSKLLDRRWALHSPATPIHQIKLSSIRGNHRDAQIGKFSFSNNARPCLGDELMKDNHTPSFYILRDDLLHPLVNGNKARKLDALLPLLEDHLVTDVVTCGGCQSAHAAAVAVSCAERGLKSHLLLRGEQPESLTGYNLVSTLYGNVIYVPRSKYACREEMLKTHATSLVAGRDGDVWWCNDIVEASLKYQTSMTSNFKEIDDSSSSKTFSRKVVIVNEGAGDGIALLGIFRLVHYLSQDHLLGRNRALKFVIDAGTGTTAVGFGLAAMCLGLPWEINAVMLADTHENYEKQEKHLISEFKRQFHPQIINHRLNVVEGGLVNWKERQHPRKFGNILEGEIEVCQEIAQTTGILVDPVYTLAAWEAATLLSLKEAETGAIVIMLHTGGTLGMFGLAQRYKSYFH